MQREIEKKQDDTRWYWLIAGKETLTAFFFPFVEIL